MHADETLLTQLRGVGDPPADEVMESILAGQHIHAINRMLGRLLDNDDIPEECRFPEVSAFLQETRALPDWADPSRVENAERVFARYGAMAYIGLACASLPECYYDTHIAKILGSTNRLEDDVHRRFFETAQLIVAVMEPGGLLASEGTGVIACQKVRLMHAAIRRLVLARPPTRSDPRTASGIPDRLEAMTWNEDNWPVDQPALAMTLQACAASVLQSLATLGVELDPKEQDDFVHLWSVVGFLLGVDERLLPDNAAEARGLFHTLKRFRQAPSDQGRELTRVLLDFVQSLLPWYAAGASRAVSRELVGDRMADDLGIDRLGGWRFAFHRGVIQALRRSNRHRKLIHDLFPGTALAWEWLSRSLIDAMLRFESREPARAFRIPDRLRAEWRVRIQKPSMTPR